MDKTILKNAIRLLIGGYLYDTKPGDDIDEISKLIEVIGILKEIADDYEKEIKEVIEYT